MSNGRLVEFAILCYTIRYNIRKLVISSYFHEVRD